MQVDFHLQRYLSSATGLNKFVQVCLARYLSREESVRNSSEHSTTSSLLSLSLLLFLGHVDSVRRREQNYKIESYILVRFDVKRGGRNQKLN